MRGGEEGKGEGKRKWRERKLLTQIQRNYWLVHDLVWNYFTVSFKIIAEQICKIFLSGTPQFKSERELKASNYFFQKNAKLLISPLQKNLMPLLPVEIDGNGSEVNEIWLCPFCATEFTWNALQICCSLSHPRPSKNHREMFKSCALEHKITYCLFAYCRNVDNFVWMDYVTG